MLRIDRLNAWYGESHVLHDVSFDIAEGEIVCLIGRNGAGKSTTLKSIMGMMPRRSGTITMKGQDISNAAPETVARAGIALCPENRGIFSALTVAENLVLPPVLSPGGLDLDTIVGLFPNLKERSGSQGTKLSGGEQQMLAIARILRTGAKLLMLDEPTEGLAPVIVEQIGRVLDEIRKRGFTVLLVEQNFSFASRCADRHLVVQDGRIVDEFSRDQVASNSQKISDYLGL